jgi:diguanylate cyclase (GGDEF)-like protein
MSRKTDTPMQNMMRGRRAETPTELGGSNPQMDMLLKQYAMLEAELEAKRAQLHALEAAPAADVITGLANHYALHEEIEKSLSTARRYGRQHALLWLSINDFDTLAKLGTGMDNAMLTHVARLLRQNIRPTDIASRPANATFAVILNELRVLENAQTRADTIAATIALTPCVGPSRSVHITVAMGCCLFGAEDDLHGVLSKAQAALGHSAMPTGQYS